MYNQSRHFRFTRYQCLLFVIGTVVLIVGAACQVVPVTILDSKRSVINNSLDLKQGWFFYAPTPIQSRPVAANPFALARTEKSVLAVDMQTGQKVWEYPAGEFIGPGALLLTVEDTGLLGSNRDAQITALQLATGQKQWSQMPDGPAGTISQAAAGKDLAVVGLVRAQRPVHAYDLSDGEERWISDTALPKGRSVSALAVDGNEILVGLGSDLYILNADNGQLMNTVPDLLRDGAAPRFIGNKAFMWYQQTLLVKDISTGEILWQFSHTPDFYSVVDDRVYIASYCCNLYAVSLTDGSLIWEKPLGAAPTSDPVFLGDQGYLLLEDGSVLGFDQESGSFEGSIQTNPKSVSVYYLAKGLATDGSRLLASFGDEALFEFGP